MGKAVASLLPHGAVQRSIAEAWGVDESLGFLFCPQSGPFWPFLCSKERTDLLFDIANHLTLKKVNAAREVCQNPIFANVWDEVGALELPAVPSLATIKSKLTEQLPKAMEVLSVPGAVITRNVSPNNLTWASAVFQDLLRTLNTVFQMCVYEVQKQPNDQNIYVQHTPEIESEPTGITGIYLMPGAEEEANEKRFAPTHELIGKLSTAFASMATPVYPLVINHRILNLTVPNADDDEYAEGETVSTYALSLLRICADPSERIRGDVPTGVRDLLPTDLAKKRVRETALWFKEHFKAVTGEFLKEPALREVGLHAGLCFALLRWLTGPLPLPKLAERGVHLWVPNPGHRTLFANQRLIANPQLPVLAMPEILANINNQGGEHTARTLALPAEPTPAQNFFHVLIRRWTTYARLSAHLTRRLHAWIRTHNPAAADAFIARIANPVNTVISEFLGTSPALPLFRLACPAVEPAVELTDNEKTLLWVGLDHVSFGVIEEGRIANSAELLYMVLADIDARAVVNGLRLMATPARAVVREVQLHDMIYKIICLKRSLNAEAKAVANEPSLQHAEKVKR
jgi:hypothetical protein